VASGVLEGLIDSGAIRAQRTRDVIITNDLCKIEVMENVERKFLRASIGSEYTGGKAAMQLEKELEG
jgi:hypothetical protein